MDTTNKSILLTGASGGIGREIALAFAKSGGKGGVAQALLEGLVSDELSVVRADENSQGMIDSNREAPRELDKQIQEMKPKLEEAVANHRRM